MRLMTRKHFKYLLYALVLVMVYAFITYSDLVSKMTAFLPMSPDLVVASRMLNKNKKIVNPLPQSTKNILQLSLTRTTNENKSTFGSVQEELRNVDIETTRAAASWQKKEPGVKTGMQDQVIENNLQSVHLQNLKNTETKNKSYIVQSPCTTKTNIVFLKVHRTGSTTMWNIFARFALKNRLNVALPNLNISRRYQFNYLGKKGKLFKTDLFPLPPNETYNIIMNHMVFNKQNLSHIMPENTYYIGIVRDPVKHFISIFSYFGTFREMRRKLPPEIPDEYILREYISNTSLQSAKSQVIRNRMSKDYGFRRNNITDVRVIKAVIRRLDTEFDLVLVTEFYDESLILMKRKLCWELKDILYLRFNYSAKKISKATLTEVDQERVRMHNLQDHMVYEHFKMRFLNELQAQSGDFYEEVKHFKSMKDVVKEECFKDREDNIRFPKSPWNGEFIVTHLDCFRMKRNEIPFLRDLMRNARDKLKYTQI